MKIKTEEGWCTVNEFAIKHNKILTRRGFPYGARYVYKKIQENEDNKSDREIYNNGLLWFKYKAVGDKKNYLIQINE